MEKKCKYSIRKYAIGACSVMIGALLFGTSLASADEVQAPSPATARGEVSDRGGTETGEVEQLEGKTNLATEETAQFVKAKADEDTPTPSKKNENGKAESSESVLPDSSFSQKDKNTINSEQVSHQSQSLRTVEQEKPAPLISKDQNQVQPITTSPVTEEEKALLEARKQNFNKDWHFKLNPTGDQSKENVDMKDWKKLNLPHDWSIFFDFITRPQLATKGGS